MAQSNPESGALAERLASILDPLGGRTALAAHRASIALRPARAMRRDEEGPEEDAEPHDGDHHERDATPARPPSEANEVRLRADDVFPAASLAKIPIAVEVMRRVDLGQFALDERFDTSGEPRVGGGGVLDYLDPSTRLTLLDLCFLMLGVSDNTASNVLLDLVGMGEVNETLSRLNLAKTRLARRFMDFEARRAGRDNVTSASDMVTLLGLIRGGGLPGSRELRRFLEAQQVADEIKTWLPPETPIALKTGALDPTDTEGAVYSAAGFASGPGGACVFCVLTADQGDVPAARYAVGRAVRTLWDTWCAA